MRFIDREEFSQNAQQLVEKLFEGSGWTEVRFIDLSGNDFVVLCDRQYKFHAYIDDFMFRAFKKDVRTSMIYTKRSDNTIKFLIFMAKLFGKEYVDAYEFYLKKKEESIKESIKEAEKRRDNELQDILNTIDEVAFKKAYNPENEMSRRRMREEAKEQYSSSREVFLENMREDFEKQKNEGVKNLEMLKSLLQ